MLAFFHTVLDRLRGHFRIGETDQGFDEELDVHLASATEDMVSRGLSQSEARRIARVELGGVAQLREAARATRRLTWLDGCGLDLKLGLRMLRKSWGLTLIGGFAMAVTIGLGASVFTIYQTLSGTTLPLDEGDRIVAIQRFDAAVTGNRNSPRSDFERWRGPFGR